MGRRRPCAIHGLHRPDQFYFRYCDLYRHVAEIWREHYRKAVSVSVGLVRCGIAHADADRAHDSHAAHPIHPKPRSNARYSANGQHHGVWHLSAVLAARRAFGDGRPAAVVFPVACWNPAQLLLTHATRENPLHSPLWSVAVMGE